MTQIAQTFQQVVKRPADLVARYGGEEFVFGEGIVQVNTVIEHFPNHFDPQLLAIRVQSSVVRVQNSDFLT